MASKFDLNLMLVLEAIYNEGNTTRAAIALHLSQSAVSHSLAKLRRMYQDPLFVLQGQRMVPTATTERIIGRVKSGVRDLQHTLHAASHFDPRHQQQRFRLGFRDAAESLFLPGLVAHLSHNAPGLTLLSQRVNLDEIHSSLTQAKLDLVVDMLCPVHEDIDHRRLFREPFVLLARRHHPIFAQPLTLETYLSYDHVLVTLNDSGPEWIDHELSRYARRRRVVLRCQHFFSAGHVLVDSPLITTVPRKIARLMSRDLDLHMVPLPFEAPPLDVHVFWHRRHTHDPANRWLRTQIHSLVQEAG